jgi:hypothetical protein
VLAEAENPAAAALPVSIANVGRDERSAEPPRQSHPIGASLKPTISNELTPRDIVK